MWSVTYAKTFVCLCFFHIFIGMRKPSYEFERFYHSYHSSRMHVMSIFKGGESTPKRVIKTGNLFYTPSYLRIALSSRKRRYYNYLISQL